MFVEVVGGSRAIQMDHYYPWILTKLWKEKVLYTLTKRGFCVYQGLKVKIYEDSDIEATSINRSCLVCTSRSYKDYILEAPIKAKKLL